MNANLQLFIQKISSGCLTEAEISKIAQEASEAYTDPEAFLNNNPDINYDESYPIALGEWVVMGSLPETVLFQGDSPLELFEQIRASFSAEVPFVLQAKQLKKAEDSVAFKRIQTQLSSLYPEKNGYVLLHISQPLDDEFQTVLVYRDDLEAVLALAESLNIHAAPCDESL